MGPLSRSVPVLPNLVTIAHKTHCPFTPRADVKEWYQGTPVTHMLWNPTWEGWPKVGSSTLTQCDEMYRIRVHGIGSQTPGPLGSSSFSGSLPAADLPGQLWHSHHCFHQQSPPCELMNLPSPVQPQDHFASSREKNQDVPLSLYSLTFTYLKSTRLSIVMKDI